MGEKQKRFTAEEKAKILRRHLVNRVAVSDLCGLATIQGAKEYFDPEIDEFLMECKTTWGSDFFGGL
ncbi:MAG: hypothetical protein R6V10_03425 [bacterium]